MHSFDSGISKYLTLFYLCSREPVGGPRTRPLPPPREVINHDNAVKSIPQITNVQKVEPTAPVAPVEPVFLSPLSLVSTIISR